jgi:translation elongation factor P/translation initiation factor 5A
VTGSLANTARAFTLTDMNNYEQYTITLSTVGNTIVLSDTVQVMPTDNLLYLPVIPK